MADKLKVFLCHATENKPVVNGLYNDLVSAGYEPWLDTDDILPGMAPDMVIQNALHECDIVIICLSSISVAKEGYVQKEIKWAQGIQDEKPEGTIFVIPLRLDNCNVPFGLKDLQWGDYTAPDGYDKLVQALNIRAQQLGKKLGNAKKVTLIFKDAPPPVGDLPIGSYLPFPPNPLFEGRVDDLKKLAESLLNDSSAGMIVNQKAVTGMGGLGKTQLAVEFAYRYGSYYRGVHWLNLADPSLLDSEIAQCGAQMGLADWPDDQPSQVTLTLNTWKADGPRLLVLDNFEAVEQVNSVLTRLRHSNLRLLITSRRTDWPSTAGLSSLPLELFAPEESLSFLKKALDKRKEKDEDLAILAERLGHLPLALELASRYLNGHPRLTLDEYLLQAKETFDHPSMRDWRADLPAPTQHDLDLQRTFALSWEAVKDETAKSLFQMAGYLAPNTPIPNEIFEKALEISSDGCDEILNVLYGLGLLRKSENDQPTIHPLLAEYARGLAKEKKGILKDLADALGTLSSQTLQTGLPSRFLPIRSHLSVISSHAEEAGLQIAGILWNNYGVHLDEIADYSGARIAYEHALNIDPDNAARINNLGETMRKQGELEGARTMYERAIKIWETNLGTEYPQVAFGVNNLGVVMKEQGELEGARTMFERAIKIWEANLGTEHPQVAVGVNNLGSVLRASNDLAGARIMYERVIKIWEANLGGEHPQVAVGVNNLGGVLLDSGDLAGARTMFERALKIDETAFGKEHPKVATRLWWLGVLARDEGNKEIAKDYFERALNIYQKFLPPEHPTIKSVKEFLDSLGE